jgi:proteasome lid subunit RPN8/RPN11
MAAIRLNGGVLTQIVAQAEDGFPCEVCGILIGRQSIGFVELFDVFQVLNLSVEDRRNRYEVDPSAMLAASVRARESGLEVVGIWHSHPNNPAAPSEADRIAAWAGWSYVIVSVTCAGIAEVRSWRLNGIQFQEEEIEL